MNLLLITKQSIDEMFEHFDKQDFASVGDYNNELVKENTATETKKDSRVK